MSEQKKSHREELLDLEERYWQALKDEDAATAMALTDENCLVTGAQGVGKYTKKQLGEMMANANYKLTDFRLEDAQVRMLGEDVAIIAYKVHEDLIVEGKPISLDAAEASTWVKRAGGWRCALHTESLLGDAFGRDRTAARAHAGA